jgi:GntR family transcriptional regulator
MIVLDYQDRRPIYEQIAEKFQLLILKGVLEENAQMPSVRKLAMDLSINPNTIQRAYTLLESQGYVYPVKGRGNFVSPRRSFMEEEKKQFFQEFDLLVVRGTDIGVAQRELVDHINRIYKEEQA